MLIASSNLGSGKINMFFNVTWIPRHSTPWGRDGLNFNTSNMFGLRSLRVAKVISSTIFLSAESVLKKWSNALILMSYYVNPPKFFQLVPHVCKFATKTFLCVWIFLTRWQFLHNCWHHRCSSSHNSLRGITQSTPTFCSEASYSHFAYSRGVLTI